MTIRNLAGKVLVDFCLVACLVATPGSLLVSLGGLYEVTGNEASWQQGKGLTYSSPCTFLFQRH